MNSNVAQVGGDHYQSMYQHWDWCAETGLPYLESCATKYITRWRKKDGVQGLKKAISYLQKIKELGITVCPPALFRLKQSDHRRERFLTSNGFKLGSEEEIIITAIDLWDQHSDLDDVIRILQEMINRESAAA